MIRVWLICIALVLPWQSSVQAQQESAAPIRPLFALAGDSTVTHKAGWGLGFAELLHESARMVNLAQGGRSSRSYRTEGWWQKCLDLRPEYVLIQFGHNDQPGKGPERESDPETDFRDHLRGYVIEARAAGITPVLLTSLTRRRWDDAGNIIPTLAEYAEATRAVAAEMDVPLIPLHRLSIEQCEQLGPTAFRRYEPMQPEGADHTHLNAPGSRAVAAIVVRELQRLLPELMPHFVAARIDEFSEPKQHAAQQSAGALRLAETADTIEVTSGNRHVLSYRKTSPPVPEGMPQIYHRSGILHPVHSPAGVQVTAMFPEDHPHQHGVFSAWTRSTWNDRKLDFWNLAGGTGRVLHREVVNTSADDDSVAFVVDLIHRAVEDPVVDILHERWTVRVHQADAGHFCFDIESEQQNQTEIPLILEEYHYGGMAIRGPVAWLSQQDRDARDPAGTVSGAVMTNEFGSDRRVGNHEHTRWVVMSGANGELTGGVAVLCHRDNFRAPQAARLHPTKPYFVFSPCVDGQFTIEQGLPYRARYRYLVFDGAVDQEWIGGQWDTWHAEQSGKSD